MARKGTVREVFIQRALDLFLKNGVRTTMDDISRQLKISKRTIYEQFEDKSELMRACVSRYMETQTELPDLNTCDVVTTVYLTLRDDTLNLFGENSNFILNLQVHYPEIYEELFYPRVESVLEFVRSGMRKGMEQGLVREDMDPEVFCSYLVKFIFQITSDTGKLFRRHTYLEIFHSSILPFLRGVLTLEGIRRMDEVIRESEKK
jgi:AcrR family transcriptional regulator